MDERAGKPMYASEETQGTASSQPRYGSNLFHTMLQEMADIHEKKSHDYASANNPYGNYEFAAIVANLFAGLPDVGFVSRLAEKLYRLANLESRGLVPVNEAIEDTERDICVITLLWMASRREARLNQSNTILGQNLADEAVKAEFYSDRRSK